ncbi:MAG: flagellar basal body-associated FliL family protein [Chloroflexi bacterium]|nr:flagellar basal body-associated FliL family protein [Chloroflexota bacterium]
MKALLGKKIVIIVVAVLVLAGGGAGAYLTLPMFRSTAETAAMPSAEQTAVTAHSEAARTKESGSEPGMMYQLAERIVNLADPGGMHYLKIQIVLEYDLPGVKALKGEAYKKRQDEFVKEMASRRPMIDDTVTSTLAGTTSATFSGSEGKEKLREELKEKLAAVSGESKLVNVYFTQLVVQ